MHPETIIIADDHPVFRAGLCSMIRCLLPNAIVVAADTMEEAVALAQRMPTPPSMLILDLFFSRRSILDALPRVRREFSQAGIVIVSMADDQATVDHALACGVNGYISKAVAPQAMMEAFTAVREGELIVQVPQPEPLQGFALTPRQTEVLQLISAGKTNKEIAIALGISPFTVQIHATALFRSLGVTTRAAAVAKAMSAGFLQLTA
ncbi:LuxR C-terminal-related transcriptional regulator [Xanthomonas campestris]|uniref:LuxR C-terminal-related transcriptional regulator n=1 Tax=Xanthomonas campestris TaxID=339 RepID=UPI003556A5D0